MSFDIPKWTVFTPGRAPELPVPVGEPGRVVGLMATDGAVQGGWAAEVACGLVESWSATGLRMVLADAGLDGPTLHAELSVANGEGLSDALVWGVSVKRVARAVRDRGFYVVTAGTPVADTQEAFAGRRWGQLCEGFRQSGVNLVLLVPADESSVASVLAHATDVVVLAAPEEDVASIAWDVLGMVRGVVGLESGVPFELNVPDPPSDAEGPGEAWSHAVSEAIRGFAGPLADGSTGGETAPPLETPPVETLPAPEAFVAAGDDGEHAGAEDDLADPSEVVRGMEDSRATVHSSDETAAPPPPAPPFEEIVRESQAPPSRPGRGRRKPSSRGGSRNVLLLILLVVVLGALVAGWLGYLEIPGITPSDRDASSEEAVPEAAADPVTPSGQAAEEPPPAPSEVSAPLAFSLAIAAYRDPADARRRAATLALAVPDVLFSVIPVEVSGTLYHRVLAGPASDSADAAALATRVAQGAGLNPTSWVVRPTPGAFHLGETAELTAAEVRAEQLLEAGLPAYVLAVDYSDGSTGYRIYVGAYADELEASYLSNVLAERGLGRATFSQRIGRLPE